MKTWNSVLVLLFSILTSKAADFDSLRGFPKKFGYQTVKTFSEFVDYTKPTTTDLIVFDVDNTVLVDGYYVKDSAIVPGLKQLVEKKIPFIFLTARVYSTNLHKELMDQLDLVNYYPFPSLSSTEPFYFGKEEESPVFMGCVLYVKYRKINWGERKKRIVSEPKGECLEKFLSITSFNPQRIAFIDDKEDYLRQVHKIFKTSAIETLLFMPPARGLHDGRLDGPLESLGRYKFEVIIGVFLLFLLYNGLSITV